MEIRDIILLHDQYLTSVISRYRKQLEVIVAAAIAGTISELHKRLKLGPNGTIEETLANQRVLRKIDVIFQEKMEEAGYSKLSESFADSFANQLPFLDDILDTISAQLKKPLPNVREVIDAEDRRILASQQVSVVDNLDTVVSQVAAAAKQKVLFGVNGLPVTQVATMLARVFQTSVPKAETLADTSATIFFRVVTEKAYDVIQKDIPGDVLRFEYEGPEDEITRVYCISMLERTKLTPLTKAEINKFPNGQLPSPFISCGGFNCRHSYVLSLRAVS